MADLGGVFNARTVDPNTGKGPIPAGKYRCAMIKSCWKDNSKKTGKYLELTFEVLEGRYRGRRLWERLNLQNPSAQAVEIARGTMSAICHATGVMEPTDTVQLHNIPLVLGVKLATRNDPGHVGEKTNEIDSYESTEKAGASAAAEPAVAAAVSEPAPWEG